MSEKNLLEESFDGRELLSFYDYLIMNEIITTFQLDGNVNILLYYYDCFQENYQSYCQENEFDYEIID